MDNNLDTNRLWDILFKLFIASMVFIVGIFVYLTFQQSVDGIVHAWLNPIETEVRIDNNIEEDWDRVENGIHVGTGMAYDDNFQLARAMCTSCHSSKLIIQNRATREGWKEMIVWMQATQGLQDLGDNEPLILDYLAAHYAPEKVGRRPNLDMAEIEWYILDQQN